MQLRSLTIGLCLVAAGLAAGRPARAADAGEPRANPDPALPPLGSVTSLEALEKVGAALREERDRLAAWEKELREREENLKKLQSLVETRGHSLSQLQSSLEQPIVEREQELASEQEKQLKKLVEVFEGMGPENAAKIFPSMNDDLVVEIVLKMKGRTAGRILGLIEPASLAARLGERVAARKKAKKTGT